MSLIRRRKISQNQQRRIAKNNQAAVQSAKNQSDLHEGVVVSHFGKRLRVQTARPHPNAHSDVPPESCCHARANLPTLATGDKVLFSYDEVSGLGRIESLLARKSLIERPDRYRKVKPIAANVDSLVVVVAPEPKPAAALIDRYLLVSHLSDIPALLVFHKSDLDDGACAALQNEYRDLGFETLTTRLGDAKSLTDLQTRLDGKLAVFLGQSGVGKSSLINTLIPSAQQATNALSRASKLGQHTTTTSRLLPYDPSDLAKGGVVDTPGVREYGVWHLSPDRILGAFGELQALSGDCLFRDCPHTKNSKGCALWQAAKNGDVLARRIESLLCLQQEAKDAQSPF